MAKGALDIPQDKVLWKDMKSCGVVQGTQKISSVKWKIHTEEEW